MKNSIYISVLILLGCVACQSNRSLKEGNSWNLEMAMNIERVNTLEECSDSIVYIPLETNDSSLLANRAYLLYADNSDIFVKSNDYLYRFNADGHYLNRIGRKGMAPGEYARLESVSVDRENRRIFCYTGNNKGQYWGYDGAFLKEIVLDGNGKNLSQSIVSGSQIVAERREYTDSGLRIDICFFSLEGALLQEIPLAQDDKEVNVSMHTVPLVYTFGGDLKYKDTYSPALLSFNNKGSQVEWIFDLGKYEPSREYLEDMNKRGTLMREMVQLVDIKESRTHFFLLLVHDYRLRGVVMDKESGTLVYSKEIEMPQKGGGIELGKIKGGCFWPSFADNSRAVYGLVSVSSLPEESFQAITHCALNHFPLTEDSNPVVVKAFLKK